MSEQYPGHQSAHQFSEGLERNGFCHVIHRSWRASWTAPRAGPGTAQCPEPLPPGAALLGALPVLVALLTVLAFLPALDAALIMAPEPGLARARQAEALFRHAIHLRPERAFTYHPPGQGPTTTTR